MKRPDEITAEQEETFSDCVRFAWEAIAHDAEAAGIMDPLDRYDCIVSSGQLEDELREQDEQLQMLFMARNGQGLPNREWFIEVALSVLEGY